MAVINTEPVKQKVYTKLSDGSLSPVSYWTYSDSIEMPDGTNLTEYLQKMGDGATIYLVNQEDTSDIDTAIATLDVEEFNKGQMLVIANSNDDTAGYVYNGTKWIAFSGNVKADNVIFTKDIICAGNYEQVGNVNKTKTGLTTISSAGKSLQFVMEEIFTKQEQPTKTNPSVTITLTGAGDKEVGSTFTPSYKVTTNLGKYTYDTTTGVSVESITVTDGDNTSTDATGSFNSITIEDDTDYKLTVTMQYSDGNIATTNLGNDSNPIIQIKGGSTSATSSAVKGYRSFFYGVVDNINTITSAMIRGLHNSGKAYKASETFTVRGNEVNNPKRIIVAYPANCGRSGISKVIMPSAMNATVTGQYVLQNYTVNVQGVNGYTAEPYAVWVYEPASLASTEVHQITLA